MARYGKDQVKEILDTLGIRITSETPTHFLGFCPFHHNTRTPAFQINKEMGLWNCFNQSCDKKGTLPGLVERLTGRDYSNSIKFIGAYDKPRPRGAVLSEILDEMFEDKKSLPTFPQVVIDHLVEQFWLSDDAIEYMKSRGFTYDTMHHFQIGLSAKQDFLITYPVYTPDGDYAVGVVGRGLYERKFKNSNGLPRKQVLFNIDQARRFSPIAILVESGFDAMRIHQAGFPNTVAALGSNLSSEQVKLLERNFTSVVMFQDNDEAGFKMYENLRKISRLAVLRARWSYDTMYPEVGAGGKTPKDASDLTDTQIKTMIKNAEDSQWL